MKYHFPSIRIFRFLPTRTSVPGALGNLLISIDVLANSSPLASTVLTINR